MTKTMKKTATAAVQPIKPAATVIIAREGAEGGTPEIFMLRRTNKAAFAGGMYVFPGGKVDADDHLHKYDEHRRGPSDAQTLQQQALGPEWRGYWIAGIRETFEEAGLLLAYTDAADLLSYNPDNEHLYETYRHQIHSGELSLFELCRRESLNLAVDRIHYVNRFVTPAGRPRRFDTRFFLAVAPPEQVGLHDDKETVESTWISASEALTRHAAQEFDLMVVTRMQLEMLAEHRTLDALVDWAQANLTFPVYRPSVPRN